jgi:DHA1 family multidrug resistance protein-like MFS transporter
MAFSFVGPFMPLYIMEIGNYTSAEAAFWTGITVGCGGVAMFVSAPIWGIVSDRWGRKSMVLRAQFCGAVLLALMAVAPNIYVIIVLRILQGALTGTITAASALVASQTPRSKLPFAMGLIMVAVFGGTTVGPFIGGFAADQLGYGVTFLIAGAILFAGGLIVLFLVEEKFVRLEQGKLITAVGGMWRLATSRKMFTLLAVMCIMFACPQMIAPIIPLAIREMAPEAMAATESGLALGIMGLLSAVSAFVVGRLGGRIRLKTMLVFSCFATAFLYLFPIWAGTVTLLVVTIGLTGLFIGGLQTPANTLVGLSVPREQQGIAYGLAGSANSLGMGLGSLAGGSLAALIGLRPVFGVAAGLFIVVGLMVSRLIITVKGKGVV